MRSSGQHRSIRLQLSKDAIWLPLGKYHGVGECDYDEIILWIAEDSDLCLYF